MGTPHNEKPNHVIIPLIKPYDVTITKLQTIS